MSNKSSAGQFLELCIDPDGLFVRIDLHYKNITTGFKDWFSWHVDTVQVEVARKVYHFIEPNGDLVGMKSSAFNDAQLRRCSYE